MRMHRLYLLIFILCTRCASKPVTDDEVQKYANDFAHSLANQKIKDHAFLKTFGVATSEELYKLEATSVVPAHYYDEEEIKKWSFSEFQFNLDSLKTEKYLVTYSKNKLPVSEWVFSKNPELLDSSFNFKNIFTRMARVTPSMSIPCGDAINPQAPNVTLLIGGQRVVVRYGLEFEMLSIYDGHGYHNFRVIEYKRNLYVIPLSSASGRATWQENGIELADFHNMLAKGFLRSQDLPINVGKL